MRYARSLSASSCSNTSSSRWIEIHAILFGYIRMLQANDSKRWISRFISWFRCESLESNAVHLYLVCNFWDSQEQAFELLIFWNRRRRRGFLWYLSFFFFSIILMVYLFYRVCLLDTLIHFLIHKIIIIDLVYVYCIVITIVQNSLARLITTSLQYAFHRFIKLKQ